MSEDLTKKIAELNARSEELNKERQKALGQKETLEKQLQKGLAEYNKKYKTKLTVETLDKEKVKVEKKIKADIKKVEEMLSAIDAGNYAKATELTEGVKSGKVEQTDSVETSTETEESVEVATPAVESPVEETSEVEPPVVDVGDVPAGIAKELPPAIPPSVDVAAPPIIEENSVFAQDFETPTASEETQDSSAVPPSFASLLENSAFAQSE